MRSLWRRAIALILIPLVVSACYTWQLAEPTPAEYLETHNPKSVRIVHRDGSKIELQQPELRGDSIWGQAQVLGVLFSQDTVRGVTVAVSDIQRLEERRFSMLMTVGATVGVVATLGTMVYVLSLFKKWGDECAQSPFC